MIAKKHLHSIPNADIAKLFYEIADILEMQGVDFKPVAYRKAAQSIEFLQKPLVEYYEQDKLREIPGIGEHLADKIAELLETGKLHYYDKLKKQLPPGITKLMDIPSMGPKKIKRLYQELKIRTISDLQKAIKQHKIQELKGFGEKSEQDIAEGLAIVTLSKDRFLLGEAYPIADAVKQKLLAQKFVKEVSLAGSVLRMKETVHDVDILATSNEPPKVISFFMQLPEIRKVLAKGATKASIITQQGMQMDLRVVPPEQYGSALQYFSGSKEHGVATRRIAIERGYKLSEYGLFDRKTNRLVESRSEPAIYKRLGMQWVPPELRENQGEIGVAQEHKLPQLVELKDIRGDFHSHTNYSEGNNTLLEMATEAKRLGRKYLVISDHSVSNRIANGMPAVRLLKQLKEIDKLNDKLSNITLLKSAEVDIKADGSLDYPDSALKQLDLVVAAIHSGFKRDNTQRMLRAMGNKYVSIIAHPTGRLLNQRNPYDIDLQKIYEKAAETGIALEINAFPNRLDLNDVHIREAIANKVKFTIGTDAHSTAHLSNMIYGVAQARRGWAEKKDILNCLDSKKVLSILHR